MLSTSLTTSRPCSTATRTAAATGAKRLAASRPIIARGVLQAEFGRPYTLLDT